MKDRAWFEQQLGEIRRAKDQARANLHACEGAEQFCTRAINELLAEAMPASAPTSTTAHSEFPASFTTTTADSSSITTANIGGSFVTPISILG